MRAKTVNENGGYPPGGEFDPKAPWNESDNSITTLEFDKYDNIYLSKKDYISDKDYEEDIDYIDLPSFERLAAEKLGIDITEKLENEEFIEIKDIEEIRSKSDIIGYKFITNWGTFETNIYELEDL